MTQHTTAIPQCWLTYDTNVVDDTGAVKGLNKECQEAALVFVFPEALGFFSYPLPPSPPVSWWQQGVVNLLEGKGSGGGRSMW